MRLPSFSCAVVALFLGSVSFAQTTWYVGNSGFPPGSGTATDPYTTLQYAIAQPSTVAGDTIVVYAGTYAEHVDFLGKDLRVQSLAGAASTILDGTNSGSVVSFTHGETSAAVLDGFTIRNGLGTSGTEADSKGGGVYCSGASPTLRNLDIRSNRARYGSGLYCESSTATLQGCMVQSNVDFSDVIHSNGIGIWSSGAITAENCTIRSNASAYEGGGVYGTGTFTGCTITLNRGYWGGGVYGEGAVLVNCTLDHNFGSSSDADPGRGGGVFGPATLTGCTLSNNIAYEGGGALNATLVDCTLSNNQVNGIFGSGLIIGLGGGASTCTLTNCDVYGNAAGSTPPWGTSGEGAGLLSSNATGCRIHDNLAHAAEYSPWGGIGGGGASRSTLVDCDVHDNQVLARYHGPTTVRGGGVLGGSATRCRIWNNSAPHGGGAADWSAGGCVLANCTLFGNASTFAGSGALRLNVGPGTLRNCIAWNNGTPSIEIVGGTMSVTYSDVEGGFAGAGNISADPLFVAPSSFDFHLQALSPCINAGDPSSPHDADGSLVDMGAFAYVCVPTIYCTGKLNSQGCTPAVAFTGTTSISGTDDFVVTGAGFINQKTGLLFWGRASASTPFQGGTLCVHAPITRTVIQNSGGNPLPPPDCSGTYAFAFTHAYMAAAGIGVNDTIFAQWYSRDPAVGDGTGVSLSNAIEFTVCP